MGQAYRVVIKEKKDNVGEWCWDIISVEDTPPENYKPVEYTFIE